MSPALNLIKNTTTTATGIEKIYLTVPISEKDEAKLFGAKWDKIARKWFTTEYNENKHLLFERWKPNDGIISATVDSKSITTSTADLRSEITF